MLVDLGLLILRVVVGSTMFVAHGWGKFENFATMSMKFPDPIGLGSSTSLIMAIGAECVCSALLVAGIATRFAAVPLLFTMAVAFFVVHGMDPWKVKELSFLYGTIYLTLVLMGPGRFSADYLLHTRRNKGTVFRP